MLPRPNYPATENMHSGNNGRSTTLHTLQSLYKECLKSNFRCFEEGDRSDRGSAAGRQQQKYLCAWDRDASKGVDPLFPHSAHSAHDSSKDRSS